MGNNNGSILRALSPAYAGREGELTAVLQYVYQSVLLDGCGKTEEAKTVLKIAIEEMGHLEKIGSILVSLGVPPVYTACPPYPVAYYSAANVDYVKPLPLMMEADIRAEKGAIAYYTRILRTIDDEAVCAEIRKIRADEERHLAMFEEILRSIQPTRRDPQA